MSIGQILAMSGQNIGSQIGSGYAGLGRDVQGMLTGIGGNIRQKRNEREAMKMLEQLKNDPQGLAKMAQQYGIQGNTQLATVFQNAAKAARTSQAQSAMTSLLESPTMTPETLMETARQLNRAGQTEQALALMEKARTMQQEQQAGESLQARREAIAASARKLGLDELAERALNTQDEESLRAIQKDLRDFEIKEIIRTRGIPGRKALAKNAGIDFEDYMADLSPEAFVKVLEGEEATLKAFLDPDGNEIMLEVDKQGRVKDPNTGQKARASELKLRPAVGKTQVENIANFKNEKLAEEGIKYFRDLHDSTVTVVQTLNNIEEVLPLTDEMIAGATAQPELFVRRIRSEFSEFLDIDASDPALQNTEAYIALAAPRVADIIQAFGAGTGLSDADREFAAKAAAGDISMTPQSLQRILKILKKASENKLSMYNDTVKAMQKEGLNPAANGFVLPRRTTRTPVATPAPVADLPPGFVED